MPAASMLRRSLSCSTSVMCITPRTDLRGVPHVARRSPRTSLHWLTSHRTILTKRACASCRRASNASDPCPSRETLPLREARHTDLGCTESSHSATRSPSPPSPPVIRNELSDGPFSAEGSRNGLGPRCKRRTCRSAPRQHTSDAPPQSIPRSALASTPGWIEMLSVHATCHEGCSNRSTREKPHTPP